MDKEKVKICVLVSGGGTNLGALIGAEKSGILTSGKISLVISSNADAYALTRAKEAGIKTAVVDRRTAKSREEFEQQMIKLIDEEGCGLVVLAGFLIILSESFIRHYEGRIINIHPSLIPSFCGEGYYGLRVHEAALARGVKVTGATVHYVNKITDGGEIIEQRAVYVREDDTPKTLQRRVMEEAEWIILPKATELVCQKILSSNKANTNKDIKN
ncbi:MAG: phosphoribosylglycinamide formyltransferase [Clostridiales bacterium]|jgi:phosphoribosylglycinamide formyltransferase-1|nr:phosphoribosylglycinamide formyltransferase [Clostridiales bacterium]